MNLLNREIKTKALPKFEFANGVHFFNLVHRWYGWDEPDVGVVMVHSNYVVRMLLNDREIYNGNYGTKNVQYNLFGFYH